MGRAAARGRQRAVRHLGDQGQDLGPPAVDPAPQARRGPRVRAPDVRQLHRGPLLHPAAGRGLCRDQGQRRALRRRLRPFCLGARRHRGQAVHPPAHGPGRPRRHRQGRDRGPPHRRRQDFARGRRLHHRRRLRLHPRRRLARAHREPRDLGRAGGEGQHGVQEAAGQGRNRRAVWSHPLRGGARVRGAGQGAGQPGRAVPGRLCRRPGRQARRGRAAGRSHPDRPAHRPGQPARGVGRGAAGAAELGGPLQIPRAALGIQAHGRHGPAARHRGAGAGPEAGEGLVQGAERVLQEQHAGGAEPDRDIEHGAEQDGRVGVPGRGRQGFGSLHDGTHPLQHLEVPHAEPSVIQVTVSAQFGFKQEQSSFSESVATRKGKVLVLSLPKVQISIDPSFFVVNPAFVDAVKAFLAKVRRPVPAKPRTPPPTKAELDAFLEVVARWGILFPRTVVMGAKLYNTEDSTTENSEQGQDRSRTINAGAGVDVSFGRIAASFSAAYSQGTSSSAQNSWLKEAQKSGFSVVGGDETLYDGGDLAAWRQSVNPWSKWQVIEVQDVQPVDTLLPDDLAKAVHPFVDGLVARTQKMVDDINEALMRSVAEQQVKAKAAKDRAEKEAADKYAADLAPRKLLRSAVVKAAKDKRGRITFDCPQNLGKINIVSAQYCPSRPGKPPPRKKGAPPPPPPPPPGPPVSGPPNPCTDQCQPKDVTSLLRNYCKQPPMGSNIKDMQRTYGYLSDSDEHSCAHTAFNKAMDEVYGDPCKGDKSLFVTYTCDRE
ncbi:hypothetical protein DFJ74DRAFT_102887 [Hyaloraphidium curvatum]|nr:hypothetical protein DFJ74DRAFT_102887 [Hyaloraphidium curvatum]